ncbi:uncharacterized protein LOC113549368 isoform X1 [Rhopalosiphum maidis]|uniref:uncharacterized protein LOC113549368 isoform X1 n=2 Tax=Rhopalosiphum maidis TaxID=43146 RepID=UPI000F004193|nr:uncharacterized protein LOC113549368 isoform X1 [Rhopalosiphum maidis]
MMDSSPMFHMFIVTSMVLTAMVLTTNGQINRYINPTWLEMDANSEYYPGGEVISQILQAYGLGDNYGPSRLRSTILDRNGYRRSYPRNRIVNNLNNAYDSDPLLTQEYVDRNYDYVDNTIRGSNYRYRSNLNDIPRRTRINMVSAPRTTYYPADYIDRDSVQPLSYSRSRIVTGDPAMSQELVVRGRETARLIPRSTVATDTNEKRKV